MTESYLKPDTARGYPHCQEGGKHKPELIQNIQHNYDMLWRDLPVHRSPKSGWLLDLSFEAKFQSRVPSTSRSAVLLVAVASWIDSSLSISFLS